MKKLLFSAVIALFAVSAATAQERGQWAVGPKLGIYTNAGDAITSIGVVGRYSITDNWRVEPSFSGLLHKDCSIEISCDIQYQFHLDQNMSVYPLVGVVCNDIGQFAAGLNVGAGFDFSISRNVDFNTGLKWQPMFDDDRSNPVVIFIGGTYKF